MSVIDPNKLLISSDFYSVQGEGKSSGVPSYFVRLGICNFNLERIKFFHFTNNISSILKSDNVNVIFHLLILCYKV